MTPRIIYNHYVITALCVFDIDATIVDKYETDMQINVLVVSVFIKKNRQAI